MGGTCILALVMGIVGGMSIYESFSSVPFYSRPFCVVGIVALIIATALFGKPLITKRAMIWFWLVASPLVLFTSASFGVLAVNYILDTSKAPAVHITFKGFRGSVSPTAAEFHIDVSLTNDSAYEATLERVSYEVYYGEDRIGSADRADLVTIGEKKKWSDFVEVVCDNFTQETVTFLYESLEVYEGALPLEIRGSVRLRFGSTVSEKPFGVTYVANSRGPGWSIKLEDF